MKKLEKLRKMFDRTLILYLVIGVLNFILCTGIMFLLFNVAGFSEHIAPVVNYGLGSLIWYLACRFVLFRGNKTTLFMGTNAGKVRASLVNCTVTDNEIGYTFHTFKDPDYQLDVVNSAFVGNRNKLGQACDIAMASAVDDEGRYGISLRNCLYGSTSVANLAGFALNPATLYRLGEGGIANAPLFKGSGAYPYEPKWSSPLVGRGMLMDWMTAAYDIRGDISDGKYRRLRDGKVDIGCYQSWLDPTGLVVLLQ